MAKLKSGLIEIKLKSEDVDICFYAKDMNKLYSKQQNINKLLIAWEKFREKEQYNIDKIENKIEKFVNKING